MRDLMPEPMLRDPPGRQQPMFWTLAVSLMLHAGLLALLLLPPLRISLEAPQPPAIDVELVPPPETTPAASATEEPASDEPQSASETEAPAAETATEAPASPADAPAEPAAAEEEPVEASADEPASAAAPEASAAAQPTAEAPSPDAASPQPSAEAPQIIAPVPLSRPSVRGLTAPSSDPEDGVAALADGSELTEGAAASAATAEPDVATLELGPLRSAERFYLEAMLGSPGMERARDALQTLPPDKRLAQTCNIEALAQIGYAGAGFAPDVVMAEAYASSEVAGTQLRAPGAIFRSDDKWYGFAFECTLSDDLTQVTAFSYRLGADVTDAVLARLNAD